MRECEPKLIEETYNHYLTGDTSKTSSLFSFLGTISIFLSAYGYVYAYPYLEPDKFEKAMEYYPDLLVSVSVLVILVLALLYMVSLNFGYTSSKCHVMLMIIRNEYIEKSDTIFPTNVKNKVNNFIPDYYQIFCIFMLLLQIFVGVSALLHVSGCVISLIVALLAVVLQIFAYRIAHNKFKHYINHYFINKPL